MAALRTVFLPFAAFVLAPLATGFPLLLALAVVFLAAVLTAEAA
ncbi:hypothetical protein [Oenococcus oeni]|nr:hypothetical protein [Oenococcus oeni]